MRAEADKPGKAEVVAAAVRLAREGGYVAIPDVAGALGAQPWDVSCHFPSDSSLIDAVAEEVARVWEKRLNALAGEAVEGDAKVRAYIGFVLVTVTRSEEWPVAASPTLTDRVRHLWRTYRSDWFAGARAMPACGHAALLIADGALFDDRFVPLSVSSRVEVLGLALGLLRDSTRLGRSS